MAFELQLSEALSHRADQVDLELAAGDGLETVLGRHLVAVEAAADTDLVTSILLLDPDGKRLRHGAAPSLPVEYCEAIDGVEIGPNVGSCGTAAYLGHAIYVTDIAADPLWQEFRHLALPHGLQACWSTPIRDDGGSVIGTFAIYHHTPRSPTPDEVEAIRLITVHVSQAIMWSRNRSNGLSDDTPESRRGHLKLVSDNDGFEACGLQIESGSINRLQAYAAKLDRFSEMTADPGLAKALKASAADCRNLIQILRAWLARHDGSDLEQ